MSSRERPNSRESDASRLSGAVGSAEVREAVRHHYRFAVKRFALWAPSFLVLWTLFMVSHTELPIPVGLVGILGAAHCLQMRAHKAGRTGSWPKGIEVTQPNGWKLWAPERKSAGAERIARARRAGIRHLRIRRPVRVNG